MSTALVPVKKVAFGSPQFMWLQRDIDLLCEQRRLLGFNYSENKSYIHFLTRTINNLAGLVYFKPKTFSRPGYTGPKLTAVEKAKGATKAQAKKKGKKVPMKMPPSLF